MQTEQERMQLNKERFSNNSSQPHMFAAARIVSVNVGMPRKIELRDRVVLTSILKAPVEGRVALVRNNIEGDQQSDHTVHGSPYQAVYGYPVEHYRFWSKQFPGMHLPHGMFGENLTTEGFTEEDVYIGDQFRVGTAVLQVTQPRMPCYKLAIRFGRADIVKRFWQSERSGYYLSVVSEGNLAAGDSIERLTQGPEEVSVADVVRLYRGNERSPEMLERALKSPLFGSWKEELKKRWNRQEPVSISEKSSESLREQ
jgi:MOSC domain-containing protein YiiM